MDLNELTIGEAKEIVALVGATRYTPKTHSFVVGEKYIIRTVTYHSVGRLKAVTDSDLVLEKACWVADSGRWSEALRTGNLNELEPFTEDVIINRDAIVDATKWICDLPKEVK
jgi:hypothetical protein